MLMISVSTAVVQVWNAEKCMNVQGPVVRSAAALKSRQYQVVHVRPGIAGPAEMNELKILRRSYDL